MAAGTAIFKFSFYGRQAGAIGITYKITDSYKAADIHEALSYLYEDYDLIMGLSCMGHKIPKDINFKPVRSHRERPRQQDGATYITNNA